MLCALFYKHFRMITRSFSDQLGSLIAVPFPPQRIISLVPSQTELLFDLGVHDRVVGITKFCVHPPNWLKEKQIIGGTKNFNLEVIKRLTPDLIIGNKEENYKEGINQLRQQFPVWMSDIETFHDATEMIRQVGDITATEQKAGEIIDHIIGSFAQLRTKPPKKTLYLIWREPWIGVGSNTFIHAMLELLGFTNCLKTTPRYPQLSNDEIKLLKPDLIMLSSEPYPFKEKHIDEIHRVAPSSDVIMVDGEMFSWYGSRLMKAPAYFNSMAL